MEPIAPIVAVPAEGRHHLFYEFRLTNFDTRVLRLDRLEVSEDPAAQRPLACYGEQELEAMIGYHAADAPSPRHLGPGTHAVVLLWIPLRSGMGDPTQLSHRLTFWGESGAGPTQLILEANKIDISADQPLVIDPPLRSGPWLAHAGPAGKTHHRQVVAPRNGQLTIDQRFATDWVRLRTIADAPNDVGFAPDWDSTTGQEVHAVAEGVVVRVIDGLPDDPDLDPKHTSPEAAAYRRWIDRPNAIGWDTIGGNLVAIDMGNGAFAWYEHLQQGSVRVRVGDRVEQGRVLGLVGSSGNAGAPHLHFEITDSDTKGNGNGLPYVFRNFDLISRVDPLPGWDPLVRSTPHDLGMASPTLLLRAPSDQRRTGEIPLGGSIVRF